MTDVVTFGSVKEREYTLLEPGEYCLTLSELEESEGNWGTRMCWKFLAAPKENFSDYICKANGDEYTLWAFTDQDIVLGSLAHEFVEALTGRSYGKDDAPPDEDDLLGKRIIAYVKHEIPKTGKSAGKKREAIVAGTIKRFSGPAKKIASNSARQAPSDTETVRAEAVARVEKLIGRAVKFETPNHAAYVALNLDEADLDQLEQLAVTIEAEVEAALDA